VVLVKRNGTGTTFNMIKKFFSHWIWPWTWFPGFSLIDEGSRMAHEYTDEKSREEISRIYKEYYEEATSPLVNPLKFDPLNPPKGWAFDPYYCIWHPYK